MKRGRRGEQGLAPDFWYCLQVPELQRSFCLFSACTVSVTNRDGLRFVFVFDRWGGAGPDPISLAIHKTPQRSPDIINSHTEDPILPGVRGCDGTRFDPATHLTAHRCNISQLHINNSEETAAHSGLIRVPELHICCKRSLFFFLALQTEATSCSSLV